MKSGKKNAKATKIVIGLCGIEVNAMKEYEVQMNVQFGAVVKVQTKDEEDAELKAYDIMYEKIEPHWGFEVYYLETSEM